MKSPTIILRLARPDDVLAALSWTPECEALHRWAGPSTRWPATGESLWEDINNADATTFALESAAKETVGLGQVRYREDRRGHLARVIVSPSRRGLGFGRALCRGLMREALRLHPDLREFSLYVYPDNLAAIALYHSLGYMEGGFHAKFTQLILMLAPLSAAPVD